MTMISEQLARPEKISRGNLALAPISSLLYMVASIVYTSITSWNFFIVCQAKNESKNSKVLKICKFIYLIS